MGFGCGMSNIKCWRAWHLTSECQPYFSHFNKHKEGIQFILSQLLVHFISLNQIIFSCIISRLISRSKQAACYALISEKMQKRYQAIIIFMAFANFFSKNFKVYLGAETDSIDSNLSLSFFKFSSRFRYFAKNFVKTFFSKQDNKSGNRWTKSEPLQLMMGSSKRSKIAFQQLEHHCFKKIRRKSIRIYSLNFHIIYPFKLFLYIELILKHFGWF